MSIAAGTLHTVGLKGDGTVVLAGGSLPASPGWSNVIAIAAGGYHTLGLMVDGTVVALGDNQFGQCAVTNWSLGSTSSSDFTAWGSALRLPIAHRSAEDQNGPMALPNLVAYAFGLNPITAERDDLPFARVWTTDGTPRVGVVYRQSKTAVGVETQVLGAATLDGSPWSLLGEPPVKLGETSDSLAEHWQIEVPADSPSRFLRLQVIQP